MESLPLLSAFCLLAGLAEANIAIAQSSVADVAPAAQRGRLFGYVYLSSSLAYVIGPLGGGKLADPEVFAWAGPGTPFLAVGGLLLACLALTAVRFRETHPPRPAPRWGSVAPSRISAPPSPPGACGHSSSPTSSSTWRSSASSAFTRFTSSIALG